VKLSEWLLEDMPVLWVSSLMSPHHA